MKASTLLPTLLALASSHLTGILAQQQNDGTAALNLLNPSGSTLVGTLVESTRQEPHSTMTTTTTQPSSKPSTTSLIQATRTESVYIPNASSSTSNLNADGIDVEGGASGSSSGGGFTLSQGGMIAVIVVVVCVAVFGVLSITLFILAKKRQWRVRESIKRASRRLTGRPVGARPRSAVDRRKRSGVIAGSKPGGRGQRAPPSTPLVQQKRSAVSETEMSDLEKGSGGGKGAGGWMGKMRGNNWR